MTELVRADGRSMSAARALRLSMLQADFFAKTIEPLLIRKYAESRNIAVTEGELQVAIDEMRYAEGLEQRETFNHWMQTNHQTPASLQEGLELAILRTKCLNSIPETAVRAYFAEHYLEYETVDLYSIRLRTEGEARELLAQVREERADFHVLAMEHSVDAETRHIAGFVGRLNRDQMTPNVSAAVFKASRGDLIGPLETEKGWNLLKVGAVHAPEYDQFSNLIRGILLEDTLKALQSETRITYPCLEEEQDESRFRA